MLMEMGQSYACQAYLWSFLFYFISSLQCFRLLSLPLKIHCGTRRVQKRVYVETEIYFLSINIYLVLVVVYFDIFSAPESLEERLSQSPTQITAMLRPALSRCHIGKGCAARRVRAELARTFQTFYTVQKVKGEHGRRK